MQIEPRRSYPQPGPAEWLGGRLIVEQWLGRRCAFDTLMQFIGGTAMLLAGIVAFVLTSGFTAAIIFFLVMEVTGILGVAGISSPAVRPFIFGGILIFFMVVSIAYAWMTRRETPAARGNFDSSFSSMSSLALEFIAAGPIFFVLAAQDFHKFARMSRMDLPQVSALLLWLYDKNARASFADVSLAFRGLNTVRVLPQLRDISGIYWWPEEGEIALSEELQKTLAEVIGRAPKNTHKFQRPSQEPPHFEPAPGVSDETLSWYAALNLPPFATLQQVKARYRKLAKIYHPDVRARNASGNAADSDEQMKRINEAYHNLLKHSQNQAGGFE